ncbi:unnamed protein product, partial [Prorocentrum cordatum]
QEEEDELGSGRCGGGPRRCNDASCMFAHGEEELRSTNMFYRKTLCIWNERGPGHCRNGDKCRFAHGREQLQRGPEDGRPRQPPPSRAAAERQPARGHGAARAAARPAPQVYPVAPSGDEHPASASMAAAYAAAAAGPSMPNIAQQLESLCHQITALTVQCNRMSMAGGGGQYPRSYSVGYGGGDPRAPLPCVMAPTAGTALRAIGYNPMWANGLRMQEILHHTTNYDAVLLCGTQTVCRKAEGVLRGLAVRIQKGAIDITYGVLYYPPQPRSHQENGVYHETVKSLTRWWRSVLMALPCRTLPLFYSDVNDGIGAQVKAGVCYEKDAGALPPAPPPRHCGDAMMAAILRGEKKPEFLREVTRQLSDKEEHLRSLADQNSPGALWEALETIMTTAGRRQFFAFYLCDYGACCCLARTGA